MLVTRKSMPRRTFLRGAGALALPVLDAMTPALAADAKRPIRMSFIEVPNGIIMDKWTPTTEGAGFELTRVLEPLEQFHDRMLVLSGLDQKQSAARSFEIAGDHPRACTAWLTGAHAKMTAGADLRAGISVDQVAAREFGKYTQLGSLEVGLEFADVVGSCESVLQLRLLQHDLMARRNHPAAHGEPSARHLRATVRRGRHDRPGGTRGAAQ